MGLEIAESAYFPQAPNECLPDTPRGKAGCWKRQLSTDRFCLLGAWPVPLPGWPLVPNVTWSLESGSRKSLTGVSREKIITCSGTNMPRDCVTVCQVDQLIVAQRTFKAPPRSCPEVPSMCSLCGALDFSSQVLWKHFESADWLWGESWLKCRGKRLTLCFITPGATRSFLDCSTLALPGFPLPGTLSDYLPGFLFYRRTYLLITFLRTLKHMLPSVPASSFFLFLTLANAFGWHMKEQKFPERMVHTCFTHCSFSSPWERLE